jgi:Spy/CpxP family protein refolding chaperone
MQGMQHCMAMMGGSQPHMVLQHREDLALSADQVSRLEKLDAEARESAVAHMQSAMDARGSAAEFLRSDTPDLTAYETMLREAADHMVIAHTIAARVAVQARNVLTPEQQAGLEEMGMTSSGMHRMMGSGQSMMGEGHGSMADGMAAMMGCMMMGVPGGPAGSHGHGL